MFKKTPLSGGFLVVGLIGVVVFGMKLMYGTVDATWGFLMFLLSIIIFISSIISITPRYPEFHESSFDKEMDKVKQEYKSFKKPR